MSGCLILSPVISLPLSLTIANPDSISHEGKQVEAESDYTEKNSGAFGAHKCTYDLSPPPSLPPSLSPSLPISLILYLPHSQSPSLFYVSTADTSLSTTKHVKRKPSSQPLAEKCGHTHALS